MVDSLIEAGVLFVRHTAGIFFHPYETYRSISDRGKLAEFIYLAICLAVYFMFASLVKTAAIRPYLLTRQFFALASGVSVGFLLMVGCLWCLGRLFGGKGDGSRFALAWGYTLIPTLLWFLMTSLLYVLLPPPRTTAWMGMLFSIVYLVISATLFWWKLMLAYLTLRFGLKLTLPRIAGVIAGSLPVVGLWSYAAFSWGIFKVPFL